MYLYGGSYSLENNKQFFSLDLTTFKWDVIKIEGVNGLEKNVPQPRDEHSAILVTGEATDVMIIFGGFEAGQRTNKIYQYNFAHNEWDQLDIFGEEEPCPRAGHSATLYNDGQKNYMLVFGGKDDENEKLNDLWMFDLSK